MNLQCLFFFLFLFLISPAKKIVLAFEIIYPKIPGFPPITSGSKLPDYIAYFVGLLIIIGIVLSLIFLVISGIKFFISGDNPHSRKNALESLRSSILGLILLSGAILILRTINPTLVEPTFTSLTVEEGLFLSNGSDLIFAPMVLASTFSLPKGYNTLVYKCNNNLPLLIWKFPKENFTGNDEKNSGIIVVRKKCGEEEKISNIGSYKASFEIPGIYLCSGSCGTEGIVCNGNMSNVITNSTPLSKEFENIPFESVYIVNGQEERYSAVFLDTTNPKGAGMCSKIYNLYNPQNLQKRLCFDHKNDPSGSIFVFRQNYKDPKKSGNEIKFYSEPWGRFIGSRAGRVSISFDQIDPKQEEARYLFKNAKDLSYNYTGINRPFEYKILYLNLSDRLGSIYFDGKYFLELRENNNEISPCQIFTGDVNNFNLTEFAIKNYSLNYLIVIPIE